MKLKSTGVLLKNGDEIDDKVGWQRRPILVGTNSNKSLYTQMKGTLRLGKPSARSVLTSYLLSKSYILKQEKYFEASGKKS
jgi:hypothetical protein